MKLEILEDTFQKIKRDLEKLSDNCLIRAYIGELQYTLENVERNNNHKRINYMSKIYKKTVDN